MEIFSGVKVPTSLFPFWAKVISVVFPLTYAIDAVRKVVLLGNSFYEIRWFLVISVAIIVILLVTILMILKIVERHVRLTGNINLF
jgi:ABC-2 type transport system permease protein